MTTSVVTIVRGRERHLANQVRGLVRGTELPDELVVVVMGGPEPRAALAEAPFPVRTGRCEPVADELPLAAARNTGAELATGDRLVFLDVDCIPGAELVARYGAALERLDGLLVGPVRYLAPGAADGDWDEPALRRSSREHPGRAAPAGDGPVPTDRYELFWSLSYAVRRRTFADDIGGFDPSLSGYGGEDTDLAFAARAAGVPMAWVPGAVAYHQHHASYDPPLQHLRSIVANAHRFREKWDVWPMEGWLEAFRDLGLVAWDPETGQLEVLRDPTRDEIDAARRERVVS